MTDYEMLSRTVKSLTDAPLYDVTNLSNAAALLWDALDDINWSGFYLMRDGKLVLGPFQGRVACTSIDIGKGVCGTAAERLETVVVPDVREFPGHIACDSASRSEIVVPLTVDGNLYGVMDIDSPSLGRFTDEDRDGLMEFAKALEKNLGRK